MSVANEPCFECGNPAEYQHHVIPRSKGGTKTIPLCGACHGKAHFWNKQMSSGELTRAALQEKRKQGKLAGNVPFGFDLAEDGETLTPNHHEQEAIQTMLELKGLGYSLRAIGAELQERGFTAKSGGKWHAQTIKQIMEAQA